MEMETYKRASLRNMHSICLMGYEFEIWKAIKTSDANDMHWRVDGGGAHVIGSNKCFDIHHNHDH